MRKAAANESYDTNRNSDSETDDRTVWLQYTMLRHTESNLRRYVDRNPERYHRPQAEGVGDDEHAAKTWMVD